MSSRSGEIPESEGYGIPVRPFALFAETEGKVARSAANPFRRRGERMHSPKGEHNPNLIS